MSTTTDEYVKLPEVERRLGVSRRTLWRWRATGYMPAVRVRRDWLVPTSWLRQMDERARASHTQGQAPS